MSDSSDGLELEDNEDESDSLQLEENADDDELHLEGNDDEEALFLEDNGMDEIALGENADEEEDDSLQLEENTGDTVDHLIAQLTDPPVLPPLPGEELQAHLPAQRAPGNRGTAHMQHVGVVGSHRPSKAPLCDELAHNGSTDEEGVPRSRWSSVLGMCHQLMVFHTSRLLADDTWCRAFATAAEHIATSSSGASPARICVLGLGSGVPALTAARAGAQVVWLERVERLAQIARQLVESNGLSARVHVSCASEWEAAVSTAGGGSRRFDAVFTEEFDDGLLGEGALALAELARRSLLTPSRGVFAPSRVTMVAMLLSVRTTSVSGFDLRGFNAFACGRAYVSDVGEVEAKEDGVLTRMSAPLTLCDLNLAGGGGSGSGDDDSITIDEADEVGPLALSASLECTVGGIFNCVAVWYVLHLPGGGKIDLGPPPPPDPTHCPPGLTASRAHVEAGCPLPYTMRARAQRLHFVGYERAVRSGERVRIELTRKENAFDLQAPADEHLVADGRLLRWPMRNSLGYHFSMVADTTRNGCFDRAIVRALQQRPDACYHVLDIGSGSGLLAMMAMRAGARRVSSLEMVPAMAAVARHCVSANGYAESIRVHEIKSTDVEAAALGGQASLLVCELVDNELLGEGTLFSIADARRRLLTPKARIVPRGGVLFARPVELKAPARAGLNLDALKLLYTDAPFREGSYSNDGRKLQLMGDEELTFLGPPIELFSFDWENDDVDTLCDERTAHLQVTLTTDGVLTAFALYFHLHCDAHPDSHMSTGPDDMPSPAGGPPTHWDQMLRYLPAEVRVTRGQALTLVARHTDHETQLAIIDIPPTSLSGVGHVELVKRNERLSAGVGTCGTAIHVAATIPSKVVVATGGSHKAAVKRARVLLGEVEEAGRSAQYKAGILLIVLVQQMSIADVEATAGPADARLIGRLATLVTEHAELALTDALRAMLTPNETLPELLSACAGAKWLLAREVLCAKRFVDDTRMRREVLLKLRDRLTLYTREEWADAFGLPFWESFARHRKWGRVTHGAEAIAQRALAVDGSTRSLTLVEMLTLAKPAVVEGWASPLAFFARAVIGHPYEVLTTEAADALAAYLSKRYAHLGGRGTLLCLSASDGRLAAHLNATGFLPAPLIACDAKPIPTPSHPNGSFPVEALDDTAALSAHGPAAIVLSAWLPPQRPDPTPAWRAAGVREYVFVGDLTDPHMNAQPKGYKRVVLPEVSYHLLHVADAMPELAARREGVGSLCAVAWRAK